MFRPIFLVPILVVSAGLHSTGHAQAASDSVAVMQALGSDIQGHSISAVAGSFACYHAPSCDPEDLASPSATGLLRVLAEAARLPLSDESAPTALPPCPASEGVHRQGAGYMLYVGIPRIASDRARVQVARACERPASARDPILLQGEEIVLERRDGEWSVVERRQRWRS